MARILVVEDEPDLRAMLGDYLGMAGHEVGLAADASALRQLLDRSTADLVVVDLGLPGEDGLSLARWLRERHDTGIIILTGADTSLDRILGLEVGADDYLGKPFEFRELQARIDAVLRRRQPGQAPLPPGSMRFGPYIFEMSPRRLLDNAGADLGLSMMELDLVEAFVRNPGKAMTRDQLLDLAPPRGNEPFDRSIDNRITRLRKKLERDAAKPQLVKTIRGAGYLYPGA